MCAENCLGWDAQHLEVAEARRLAEECHQILTQYNKILTQYNKIGIDTCCDMDGTMCIKRPIIDQYIQNYIKNNYIIEL